MVFFYPQNPLLYHIDNYYQSDVYYSRCIIRKWKYTYILLPKYTYTYINTNIHILVPYRESTSMIHGGSLRLHSIIFTSRGFANWDQPFWQQSLSMQPIPSEISWQKRSSELLWLRVLHMFCHTTMPGKLTLFMTPLGEDNWKLYIRNFLDPAPCINSLGCF